MHEKYDHCPLKAAGFTLEHFDELPSMIFGADGRCICTADKRCINPDKRGTERCTLAQIEQLNDEARSRRAYQSGEWD